MKKKLLAVLIAILSFTQVKSQTQYLSGPTTTAVIPFRLSLGVPTPSASIHIKAGTSTAGHAPLKLDTTGQFLLSVPEAGAIEQFKDTFYWTGYSGTRYKLNIGGSSLPVGISPLYLQATGSSTYQFADPRQLDTIYIIYSGQSNTGGGAEDIGDTLSDSRVLVWDYNAVVPNWVVAHVGVSPFNTTSPVAHSPTHWWYFGRKLARLTGNYVKLVGSFANATSITGWFNTTTRGLQTDTLLNRCAASGIPRVDYFIWDQGESDPTMPAQQWTNAFDSLRFTLRRQSYFPATAKTCIVGMPDTLSGAATGFQGQEPTMMVYGYGLDPLVCFASTHIFPGADTVHVNTPPANTIHFSSNGYLKLGDRIWDAFNSIPMRDYERGNAGGVNGTNITPLHIDVVHNDPAGGGARHTGITTRNIATTGSTGIMCYSKDSSVIGSFVVPNPGVSFLCTTCSVLGTETGSDLLFHRNFTEYMRLNSTSIDISAKVVYHSLNQMQFNNTVSNSGAGFALNGDGSNFGVVSTGNSANSAVPNSMYFYFNNGYKMVMAANGTRIQDSGVVTSNAKSTLEVWGGFGMRIDSANASNFSMLQRSNTILFNTGSTTDTCFLQTATGTFGRRITIKKTDSGSGTVFVKPQSGETIDRSTSGILLSGQNAIVHLMSVDGTAWYTD